MEFRKHWKLYAVTMVLAAVLLGLADQSYLRTDALVISKAFANGTIVGIRQPDRQLGFATPVVQFKTGRSVMEFSGQAYSVLGGFQIGQRVPLMYDAQNPNDVRLGDTKQLWAPTIALTLLGAVPALLFVALLLHDAALMVNARFNGHKGGWPTAPPRPTPAM